MNSDESKGMENWITQACTLIRDLIKFPINDKIILVLRHSERDEPVYTGEEKQLLLTPLGHKIAREIGEILPNNRPIRLFYSIAKRCQETAKDIYESLIKNGENVELKGDLKPLWRMFRDYEYFINQIKEIPLRDYIFRWAAGLFLPEKIPSMISYCQNAAEIIWNQIKNSSDGGIDIHITHEIPIMAFRFIWFGLPPINKWVQYLGGFAFSFQKDQILLYDIDEFKLIEYPFWWKKKE